ncbi:Galactoside 2-alpha-L-fucosyltransferase 1 [Trichuris trichiura]|uniref:L-Fucosyltransferase n=1 Tax=Trichuris trichiura TaxID=36087 RepID=A0A077ZA74_TRITR|nr:Galactoside 2-alpha-L-fucosyltransferase 1 [Trichuris trichiura]
MAEIYIIKPATTMDMFGAGEPLFLARIPPRRKRMTACSLIKKLLTFLFTTLGALITYMQIYHQAPSPSRKERCGAIEVSCPLDDPAAIIFQYAALLGISSLNNKRPKFNCADGYEWLRSHFRAASFDADVQVMHTEKFDPAKDQCCQFKEALLNLKCERSAIIRHSLRSFLYFQDQREKIRRELAPKNLNNHCQPRNHSLTATDKEAEDDCVRIGIYMPWRHPPNESNVQMEAHFLGKAIDHFRTYHNGSCTRFIGITDAMTYTSHNLNFANISVESIASTSVKLCILSRMSGLIISGEGLSWWAAYLSNGRILYPSFFCPEDLCSWKEFYFPPEWIQI